MSERKSIEGLLADARRRIERSCRRRRTARWPTARSSSIRAAETNVGRPEGQK
jgi:hypothetical protein